MLYSPGKEEKNIVRLRHLPNTPFWRFFYFVTMVSLIYALERGVKQIFVLVVSFHQLQSLSERVLIPAIYVK